MSSQPPPVIVLMGVSGSGKSTLGEALAARLGWAFQEGDDLHPPANRAKMAAGEPLTDADRAPWLAAVAAWIDGQATAGAPGLIACSALKRAYRDQLRAGRPQVRFVWLDGARDLLKGRMAIRRGHYMKPAMLQSQLDTLERPGAEEGIVRLDAAWPTARQVGAVVTAIAGSASGAATESSSKSG